MTDIIRRAPWVASRSYALGTDNPRTAISNEKRHEFLVLENESAELWALIERGVERGDLTKRAELLGVADQIEEFLESLLEADLLGDAGSSSNCSGEVVAAPPPRHLEGAANTDVEHEMMQWAAEHGYLWAGFWEMTYRCNERCVHCFNPGAAHSPHERPERETNELTTEEGRRLLEELAELGVFRLTLSGGEALLRRDFIDLFSHARSLGMSVAFYTNGLLLTPAILEQIVALWPDSVGISIYSDDPAVHDGITGVPGSFEKSIRALESLRDRRVKTYLKSAQMRHSVGGYRKVQQLADRLGAAAEIEMQVVPGNDGAQEPMALMADDPAELIVMAATPGSPLYVGTADSAYGRVQKNRMDTVCGAGIGLMSIDPTGGITPCPSLPIPIGSFRDGSLTAAWRQSRVGRRAVKKDEGEPSESVESARILAAWQAVRLGDYQECGTHDRCGWCTKCPGAALVEHGNVLAPSTVNCRLATARMYAAKLLEAGQSLEDIRRMLGVDERFGWQASEVIAPPITLPVIGLAEIDPRESASRSMTLLVAGTACGGGCTGCSAAAAPSAGEAARFVSVTGRDGTVLLRGGSPETAKVLRSFEELMACQ
jgi:MoaA/NifB/PqqE/SkfB family radical SAM enzyme